MHWQPVDPRKLTARQSLAADALHVWWWPESQPPPTASRRARADTILRSLLSLYLPVDAAALRFGRESKGRPYLEHPNAPDFNLSDTDGGTVLVVSGTGRVGIDIERVDRKPPVLRLASRWFAPVEAGSLRELDDESARNAFLRLWTAKEASCKATGTGIFGYLSSWRFVVEEEDGPRLIALPDNAGNAQRWQFHRLAPVPSHTVVLACRDAPAVPRGFIVMEGSH
jgi:4'-phosphopantetheinyl transferase